MKKTFLLMLLCLTFCLTALAEKQEIVNPSYNFKGIKNIYLELSYSGERNGISEIESDQSFEAIMEKKLQPVLAAKGGTIFYSSRILQEYNKQASEELKVAYLDPSKENDPAQKAYLQYVRDNYQYETRVAANILKYQMEQEYHEPQDIVMNTTEYVTQAVFLPDGTIGTVVTPIPRITTAHIPGGYVNVAKCVVTFEVKDKGADDNTFGWRRIDGRSRGDKIVNLLKRITGSFAEDLKKKIKEK